MKGYTTTGVAFSWAFFVFQEVKMRVNGNDVQLPEPMTLQDFLNANRYPVKRIVVEVNGKIIKRQNFAEFFLQDADRVEIVCFVGGG